MLEEKFVGHTVLDGRLTELSHIETRLESANALAVMSNVKITVAASAQGNPAGEFYGKVVDAAAGPPGLARIRFTSTTPELKAWVMAWTGQ